MHWEAANIGRTNVVNTILSPDVATVVAKAGGMKFLFVDGQRQVMERCVVYNRLPSY